MAGVNVLEGSAGLELADGVSHLRPEEAMFEAMLVGWARQQRSRFLNRHPLGQLCQARLDRLHGQQA